VRKRIASLGLGLIVALASGVEAQEPPAPAPGAGRLTVELSRGARRERVRTEKTEADVLIFQKAAMLAQQRTARIELRKWQGVSLMRPQPSAWRPIYLHDLNAALFAEPIGWYSGPVWWPTYR
jgi:hypothetical protein